MSSSNQLRRPTNTDIAIRVLLILASGAIVTCAAELIKVVPFGRAFWDLLFVTNGAYRIGLGQVPHVDFTSPIGPLTFYLAYGSEILFPEGQPIVGLHALMWLLLLPALLAIIPRIESNLAFICAFAILALITLAPYTVDQTFLAQHSLFGIYNRFASALIFLLGLWYVLPKRAWDPWFLTYVLVLLLFLKLTAAIAAVVLIVCAAGLSRARWSTVAWSFVGLLAAAFLINMWTGMVLPYLSDVWSMARSNEGGGLALYRLASAGYRYWAPLTICALLVVLEFGREFNSRECDLVRTPGALADFWANNGFLIDAVVLVAMAYFVESQATGGVGLLSASAILFHQSAFSRKGYQFVGTAVLGTSLLYPMLDLSAQRTMKTVLKHNPGTTDHPFSELAPGYQVSYVTLEGARFMGHVYEKLMPEVRRVRRAGFMFDHDPTYTSIAASAAWAESVVDAANKFQENNYSQHSSRYAVLSFTDPFTKMLALEPAKGMDIVIDYERTNRLPNKEEASRYLASVDGLFKSLCETGSVVELDANNGLNAVLEADFKALPLNACWTFYYRDQQPKPKSQPASERP